MTACCATGLLGVKQGAYKGYDSQAGTAQGWHPICGLLHAQSRLAIGVMTACCATRLLQLKQGGYEGYDSQAALPRGGLNTPYVVSCVHNQTLLIEV